MSGFDEAVARGRGAGAAHASDSDAMAWFCESVVQSLLGAVSPRLVWEGAMKKQLTLAELSRLCSSDPVAACDLQWV